VGTASVLERLSDQCMRIEIFEAALVPSINDPNTATVSIQARVQVRGSHTEINPTTGQSQVSWITPGFNVPLQIHVDPSGGSTVDESQRQLNTIGAFTTVLRLGPHDTE